MAADPRLFEMLAQALGQPSRAYRAAEAGLQIPGQAIAGIEGGLQARNTIQALKMAPQIGQDQRQMEFLKNFGALSDAIGRKNAIRYMGPLSQRYGIDLSQIPPSSAPTTATAMVEDTSAPQIASSSMSPNISDSDTMNTPIIRRVPSTGAPPASAPASDLQSQFLDLQNQFKNGEIGNKEYQRGLESIRVGARLAPKTPPESVQFIGNDADGNPLLMDKQGNIKRGVVPGKGPVMPKQSTMPTMTTRGSAEFAAALLPHVQEMRNLIQQADAQGYIGPGAGRIYGQFLAGTVGTTGDPQADALLGKLRTTDSLIRSGMLRTHFGARGGQQMYDKFAQMLNTGKQSAAMLNGSLDQMSSFLKGYAEAGNTGQIQTPAPEENTMPQGMLHIRDSQGGEHYLPQNKIGAAKLRDPGLQVIQ